MFDIPYSDLLLIFVLFCVTILLCVVVLTIALYKIAVSKVEVEIKNSFTNP